MSPTVPQASPWCQPFHPCSLQQRRALPPPHTLQRHGHGEEAFVILLVGKRQEIAMGSRAFKGFLLSICCPALSAAPISLCLGTAGGSCAGHVSGRSPGHLLLGQRVLHSKMVAPGAFLGDSPAEEIAAMQRGPHQCHGMPWPWGSPLLSAGIIPGQTFGALLAVPTPGLSENRSCLWERCSPHSRLAPSLPPAFPHCHFSLD